MASPGTSRDWPFAVSRHGVALTGLPLASIAGMRHHTALCCLALLTAGACTAGDSAPDVLEPPAVVPAPQRLTQAGVTDPPAPAPTARGKSESMTPPFMQHTPPRPHTRTATPRADSAATPKS